MLLLLLCESWELPYFAHLRSLEISRASDDYGHIIILEELLHQSQSDSSISPSDEDRFLHLLRALASTARIHENGRCEYEREEGRSLYGYD